MADNALKIEYKLYLEAEGCFAVKDPFFCILSGKRAA